jgi:hypothetical protein
MYVKMKKEVDNMLTKEKLLLTKQERDYLHNVLALELTGVEGMIANLKRWKRPTASTTEDLEKCEQEKRVIESIRSKVLVV